MIRSVTPSLYFQELTERFLVMQPDRLAKEDASQCIDQLIQLIRYHNDRYYVDAQPLIADVQYDQLFSLLVELEHMYPDLLRPDSPTQRLAVTLQEGFSKAQHRGFSLLSLQNTYNIDQIADWYKTIANLVGEELAHESFIIEPKYDGASVHLIYEHGYLIQGISRGDGSVGEDITENIKVVRNFPLFLPLARDIPLLQLRAEVVMPKSSFISLNRTQLEEGLPVFANTRNATAGSLRLLDPTIVAERNLVGFVHEVLTGLPDSIATHEQALACVQSWGLPVFGYELRLTLEEIQAYCVDPATKSRLLQENIEFDGLVIKINSLALRDRIGATAHHPRRAIAYKFPAQEVATKLEGISYQVGRTGVITPVANLAPVQLSGATISKATLHNFDFIVDNDIRERDFVWVRRSGEVIPYVVGPIVARRTGDEMPFVLPTSCPSCQGPLSKEEEEVAWYCTNKSCVAQLKERLKHFVSRGAMNIGGLGESIIESLVDAGLVRTYVDLYDLVLPQQRMQMALLPGVGAKKRDQILQQLEQSKHNPLWRLIHGWGIPFVGKKVSTMLATYISTHNIATLDACIQAMHNHEALVAIHGFGPQTIQAIQAFFSDEEQLHMMRGLYERGVVHFSEPLPAGIDQALPLEGVTCVITGTFPRAREEITAILQQLGATVTNSVSSKTTRLLAGESAGSKYTKAQELGIHIYMRDDIIKMVPELAQTVGKKTGQVINGSATATPSLFD